jgi:hypothetical protein
MCAQPHDPRLEPTEYPIRKVRIVSNMSRSDHPVIIALGAMGAIATVLAFLFQLDALKFPDRSGPAASQKSGRGQNTVPRGTASGADSSENASPRCEDPHITSLPGRGPSGTSVSITGSGFPSGKIINFEYHTEQMEPSRVREDGTVHAQVTIPGLLDPFLDGADRQVTIRATTSSPLCFSTTVFALTP